MIRHEQELSYTLTEQQNAILQKIKDNHTELINLDERDAFVRGISLAVKLLIEAMSSKKTYRALFRPVSRETIIGYRLSDLSQQIPHSRFVAICGRRKAPPDKTPGGASISRVREQRTGKFHRIFPHSAIAF